MEWRIWITWWIIFYITWWIIFILNIYEKKHGEKTINPSIRIYVNKIENRITFKNKTGYYLELSTPETMKLLGSTKNKKMLEITEVILVQCNIINNNYQ